MLKAIASLFSASIRKAREFEGALIEPQSRIYFGEYLFYARVAGDAYVVGTLRAWLHYELEIARDQIAALEAYLAEYTDGIYGHPLLDDAAGMLTPLMFDGVVQWLQGKPPTRRKLPTAIEVRRRSS